MEFMNGSILVVDDEDSIRKLVVEYLDRDGFSADSASGGEKAIELIKKKEYDAAIVDLHMPGMSGMEVIQEIKSIHPSTEIIILTGQATVNSAIEAVRNQVFDYIMKPASMDELSRRVHNAVERKKLILQNKELLRQLEAERNGLKKEVTAAKQALEQHLLISQTLIGESPEIVNIRKMVAEVAPTDMNVLIRGESGTGKDVVARLIHDWSGRTDTGHFVKINCPSISESLLESEIFGHEKGAFTGAVRSKPGRFEFAAGGTVFLDEIGTISPGIQAKLLQVIEHKQFTRVGGNETIEVDTRFIAATNAALEKMITSGEFRSDLFYRLKQFTLNLPALRERTEDIPLLAQHFLDHYCSKYEHMNLTIPPEMMSRLIEYDWPGNVRELKAVIGRFALKGDVDALADSIKTENSEKEDNSSSTKGRLKDNEVRSIISALTETNWNQRKAAKILGISYSTLRRKISKYAIKKIPYHSHD